MWILNLLAFSIALLVSVGITESGRNRYWPCSPRSCQVSYWSHWSHCSHQCGTSGTQTRKRIKTVAESCGGSCSFALSETRPCNTDNCQNSGTPTSQGCSCKPGYRGTCCEEGKLKIHIVCKTRKKFLHISIVVYHEGVCKKRFECIVICG